MRTIKTKKQRINQYLNFLNLLNKKIKSKDTFENSDLREICEETKLPYSTIKAAHEIGLISRERKGKSFINYKFNSNSLDENGATKLHNSCLKKHRISQRKSKIKLKGMSQKEVIQKTIIKPKLNTVKKLKPEPIQIQMPKDKNFNIEIKKNHKTGEQTLIINF